MASLVRAVFRRDTVVAWVCFVAVGTPALVALAQGKVELRSWKDASGKFEVRARLVERTPKEVKLLTDKGREITVPIDRLSKADRDHLAGLAAPADNPFAGGRPASGKPADTGGTTDVETAPMKPGFVAAGTKMSAKTELPGMGTTLSLKAPATEVPFVADPRPAPPELPATAVPLGKVEGYSTKLWGPFVTDAGAGRCLAAVVNANTEKDRSRIFLVDLRNAECRQVWQGSQPMRIWDHDPDTGVTLVSETADYAGRSGELSVYTGFESGSPRKVYGRSLPGTSKFDWVAFAGPTLVAAVVENGLYLWDLAASRLVYRVDDVDEDAPPAFSGTARQMAIAQRSRVLVLETATGKVLRAIATGGFRRAPVAFDDSGTRLAMCTANQFLVWDLVKNEAAHEATTTAELGRRPLRWVGSDMLLTGGGALVHLGLDAAVWRYSFGVDAKTTAIGDKQLALCIANNEAVVTSLSVPHDPVEGVIAALEKLGDEDMVMLPGSPIKVSVEAPDKNDRERIAEWVGRSLKRTGWDVKDEAPVTLVARIGQERKREIGITDMNARGKVVQVTLAPFFTELAIRRGDEMLWRRIDTNQLPFTIYLRAGETVQQAVDRYTKPDAEFFAELRFPPRIPAPEAARLVGSSSLEQGHWK